MSAHEHLAEQFNRKHPKPGTAPIPEGHVRLFHYTDALPQVRREGLRLSAARGESYGEPSQIWAAAGVPKADMFRYKNFVEFHADPMDLDIGRGSDPKSLEERKAHVTTFQDVPPSQIIATHEPWHQTTRYLMEHTDQEVADLGDPRDWDEGPESRAIRWHRHMRGISGQ